MIVVDKSVLSRLLLVRPPWEVRDFRVDEHTRTCEVLIGLEPERRGWFGRVRPNPWGETTHRWEHLPLSGMKLALVVALPNGVDVKRTVWMGDRGMPFTRPLAHLVFAYFKEGVSLQSVCRLLDLPLQDLWRYRLALDTGRAGAHGESAATASESGFAASRSSQPAATSILPASGGPAEGPDAHGGVPQWDHPVWIRLINGELSLDIKMFSLKLMLSRVRSQLAVITDDEVRELKIRELHRYFVKNARMLGHELKQLEIAP
jgi:hypothetical protein